MPSPFPGMDPFIESGNWADFHQAMIIYIRESLVPVLRPKYVVRVDERVYLEHDVQEWPHVIRPDMALTVAESPVPYGGSATAVAARSVTIALPMPESVREVYLTVSERESESVIAVIEILSPGNKRHGSDGRREYLNKREAVLCSAAHLVEIDVLRGGERMPTRGHPLPLGDYFATVARFEVRPNAQVFPWRLRGAMPTIPIPLADGDPDVQLDLQSVFTTVYDRAGYDYSIKYDRPVEPPLSEEDAAWVRETLARRDVPNR